MISDPFLDDKNVLIVNLTSAGPLKESVCVLWPKDHPWIDHETYVNYEDAKVVTQDWLEQRLAIGSIRLREHVSHELLAKIRNSAADSVRMDMGLAEILIKQELIDSDPG